MNFCRLKVVCVLNEEMVYDDVFAEVSSHKYVLKEFICKSC